MSESKIVVSLTTIPARLAHLEPTFRSILAQSRRADRILLYLPKVYRRKEFGSYEVPRVPDGVEVRICEFDYGPATKILPAVKEFAGTRTTIIYCDDDQIYDPGWIARLSASSRAYPNDCITDRGLRVGKLDARARKKDLGYRLSRLATLGLWNPLKRFDAGANGIVEIAMGFGGVLVRPDFFPPSVFDIPSILWTVDDIWLSGQMAVNGITIRQASATRLSANAEAAAMSALLDAEIEGKGRNAANQACVDYLRKTYGIWPDTSAGRS